MLLSLDSKQDQAPAPPPPAVAGQTRRRRRLGLALGAGAGRGWAHIGVVRELADHGITPDVVAGTSIGALVGGAYVAGKLDELEAFARGLTRRRMLSFMDLSFAGGGLITGARLKDRLDKDLAGFAIETLAIPFATVATETASGAEVVMSRGDLVEAIRASYALPGIFEPLFIGGRWLFDGAYANPVPVSVCRALGADRVIAVNLGLAAGPKPALPNPPPILDRTSGRPRLPARQSDATPRIARVMMDALAHDRIARLRLTADPPDVMINARMTTCGLFDFHRADDLIAHGRAAARRALPAIEALLAASPSRHAVGLA